MSARGAASRLALVLALAGCQSWRGIPPAELPDAPIAIHHRSEEQARRHAEALAEAARSGTGAAGAPRLVGSKAYLRTDVNVLGSFLAEALGLRPASPPPDRGRLALLDPRTGELERVASALPGAVPLAWSADHDRLLFAQAPGFEDDALQIYEWTRSRDTVRRVTSGPSAHSQACYGPDGRIVATVVEQRGPVPRSRIRVSAPGGRRPWRDLSAGPADHSPTCAPDGTAVVFARATADGRGELWVLRAPFEGEPERLVPGHQPRFASDGAWLVYTVTRGQASRIFRVRADGSGRAPVGRSERNEAWPTASPDASFVAYLSSEAVGEGPPRRRLLVRRFDGSGDRVLLTEGEAAYPVW